MTARDSRHTPMEGRDALVAAVLAVVTGLLFARSIAFDFINFDDPAYVTSNPLIEGGLSWEAFRQIWTTPLQVTWQPLTALSHLVDVSLFGLDPPGHHAMNAVWHGINAGVFYLGLKQLTGDRMPSAVVALVFAVHPLRVESVAWIAERKDVLSGFFWMLTLWLYARYVRRPGRGMYIAVFVAHAAGLMAKPMNVTLPCVLLLLDYWPLRRIFDVRSALCCAVEKLPLFALSLAAGVVAILTQAGGGAVASTESASIPARVLGALAAYGIYLKQLVWPVGLAVFYPARPTGELLVPAAVSAFLLGAITFFAVRYRQNHPYAIVGWLWYLGTLVPVIGLVQVGAQAHADRYTYLPHAGLLLAVVWTVARVGRGRSRRALAGIFVLIVVTLAGLTWRQLGFWRDSETLFGHALAVTEDNARAHDYYAQALAERGDYAGAIAHLESAVRLEPGNPQPRHNLGMALMLAGDRSRGMAQFRETTRLFPEYVPSLRQRAQLAMAGGELRTAEALFRSVLRLAANDVPARINLGIVLARQGEAEEAETVLREAIGIDPGSVDARYNLAVLLRGRGATAAALREVEAALALPPGDPAANSMLRTLREELEAESR